MGSSLKVPPSNLSELKSLRDRKIALCGLKPSDDNNRKAEQLVKEMTKIRLKLLELENPELASSVMFWEVELFEHFPGIDPDRKK